MRMSFVAERHPMVAVGFNPRLRMPRHEFVAERRLNRRGDDANSICGGMTWRWFNRRSATKWVWRDWRPWVETHGYRRWSLRDRKNHSFTRLVNCTTDWHVVLTVRYSLAGADSVVATGLGIAGPVTFNVCRTASTLNATRKPKWLE